LGLGLDELLCQRVLPEYCALDTEVVVVELR